MGCIVEAFAPRLVITGDDMVYAHGRAPVVRIGIVIDDLIVVITIEIIFARFKEYDGVLGECFRADMADGFGHEDDRGASLEGAVLDPFDATKQFYDLEAATVIKRILADVFERSGECNRFDVLFVFVGMSLDFGGPIGDDGVFVIHMRPF